WGTKSGAWTWVSTTSASRWRAAASTLTPYDEMGPPQCGFRPFLRLAEDHQELELSMVLGGYRTVGRVWDLPVGERDRDRAVHRDLRTVPLRLEIECHRLGGAVQREVTSRLRAHDAAVVGDARQLDRLRQLERRGRKAPHVH